MFPLTLGLAMAVAPPDGAPPALTPTLFELRVYHSAPGKFDALSSRFGDHTVKLFAKHGMTNVGYWVPLDNSDGTLYYVLAYPDLAGRKQSWAAFAADPEWQAAKKASEANGKLVDRVEEIYLTPTDFSPTVPITPENTAKGDRVFELRTYATTPGNLSALHARFRDHTMKLFAKHGMTNLWYWSLAEGQPKQDETLIYLLAHASAEAREASFKAFRADPEWLAVLKASEEKAGGPLTVKDGVTSVLLKPTDYSPLK